MKTKEEREAKIQKNRIEIAKNLLLEQIFSAYYPTPADEEPDYTPTSVEFAEKISHTIDIAPGDLAILLTLRGFKTKLTGTYFCWQISIKKS